MKALVVSFALAVLAFVAGCGGAAAPVVELEMKPVLYFGFMPYNDPDHMRGLFDAMAAHLAEHLKVQMRFILASDYQTMGRLMESGMLDLAWFTPASYRRIGKKVGAVALCKPFRRGRGTYRPVVVVKADSGLQKMADLKGKRFGYMERNSTSGFVVPNLMLLEIGVTDPLTFFSGIQFTYSHSNSLRGLAAGKFDGTSVYEGLPEEMEKELGAGTFRRIAVGPEVPNDPIAVRPGLEPATVEKIRNLLLTMDSYESGRTALSKLNELEKISGFVATDDRDYRW